MTSLTDLDTLSANCANLIVIAAGHEPCAGLRDRLLDACFNLIRWPDTIACSRIQALLAQ